MSTGLRQIPVDSGALEARRSVPISAGMWSDTRRILLARSLRAFGDGYVAVLLPVHLAVLGFEPFVVGVISTVTLLGSALLTLALGLSAHKVRRRPALLAASLLMLGTGLGFATATDLWPVLLIAFVGTLNPSSGDVSVFLPLEHTIIAHTVPDQDRTAMFARYSFVGATLGALGRCGGLRRLVGADSDPVHRHGGAFRAIHSRQSLPISASST